MHARAKAISPNYSAFFLKFGTILLIALFFTLADAMAASGVSPRFDGRYEGHITPAVALSAPGCRAAAVTEFVVRGGHIQPPSRVAATLAPAFDGFVTDEGFVSGRMRQGNFERQFEGRIVDDGQGAMLSGGVTDGETGCAWLVELRRIGD